eukprot:85542-Amphidinium_carterae.1
MQNTTIQTRKVAKGRFSTKTKRQLASTWMLTKTFHPKSQSVTATSPQNPKFVLKHMVSA